MKKNLLKTLGIIITILIVIFSVGMQSLGYITNYNKILDKYLLFEIGYKKIYNPLFYPYVIYKYSESSPNSIGFSTSMAGGISLIFVVIFTIFSLKKLENKNTHGSARWAKVSELKDFLVKKGKKYPEDGVILGVKQTFLNTYLLVHKLITHLLIIAPSRAGKGIGIIIPTLLTWTNCLFVLDIKGENFERTSAYRKKVLKQKILKISPYSEENSTKYNPLSEVRVKTEYEVRDCQIIADILTEPEKGKSRDHFLTASNALFVGLMLHSLYSKKNASLVDVYDFLTDPSAPIEERLQELLEKTYPDSAVIKEIYGDTGMEEGVHPIIARCSAEILNKSDRERASVISTALNKIALFKDPLIRQNMGSSDFKMSDLMDNKEKVTAYMCVKEEELDTLSIVIRIFLTQFLGVSTRKLGHKHKILLMLDEFPAFGKVPLLEKGLGYIAQYGIKAVIIAQNIGQIFDVYGENTNIISGCGTGVYYAPAGTDTKTPEYISKLLGTETKTYRTNSFKQFGGLTDGNVSYNQTGKKLLNPDEVRTKLGDKKLILSLEGKYPFIADKFQYFSDDYFKDKYFDKERKINEHLGVAEVDKI